MILTGAGDEARIHIQVQGYRWVFIRNCLEINFSTFSDSIFRLAMGACLCFNRHDLENTYVTETT